MLFLFLWVVEDGQFPSKELYVAIVSRLCYFQRRLTEPLTMMYNNIKCISTLFAITIHVHLRMRIIILKMVYPEVLKVK